MTHSTTAGMRHRQRPATGNEKKANGNHPLADPLLQYAATYVDPTGQLWTYDEDSLSSPRHASVMTGTSPSITAIANGAKYAVAFQGTNGNLWTWDPDLGPVDRRLGMMPATSPSIAPIGHDEFYAVAFQANTGNLWTLDPQLGAVNRGLGMMAGTSPSITPIGTGTYYAVAFQANTGNLWTLDPTLHALDRGLGMMHGTSPSITYLGNRQYYAVAFQANTGWLWTLDPALHATPRQIQMMEGTSPSIAPLAANNYYAVAAQGSDGYLWTLDPDLHEHNRGLSMIPWCSPGIAFYGSPYLYAVAFESQALAPSPVPILWTLDPTGLTNRGADTSQHSSPGLAHVQEPAPTNGPAKTGMVSLAYNRDQVPNPNNYTLSLSYNGVYPQNAVVTNVRNGTAADTGIQAINLTHDGAAAVLQPGNLAGAATAAFNGRSLYGDWQFVLDGFGIEEVSDVAVWVEYDS